MVLFDSVVACLRYPHRTGLPRRVNICNDESIVLYSVISKRIGDSRTLQQFGGCGKGETFFSLELALFDGEQFIALTYLGFYSVDIAISGANRVSNGKRLTSSTVPRRTS